MLLPRWLKPGLPLALALLVSALLPGQVSSQGGIRVVSTQVESRFPEGILFRIQVASEHPIKEVRVRFGPLSGNVTRYDYVEIRQEGAEIQGEVLVRTGQATGETRYQYVPPGSEMAYSFTITDARGHTLRTEPRTFTYADPRFSWRELREGMVSVLYYGPVQGRAQAVLDAALKTVERMGELLGVKLEHPIRVVMYNSVRDMLPAIPFKSRALERELITEGQAWADYGVVLVLGSGPEIRARGNTSHELTHILVDLAAKSAISGPIPTWFNEGLAEYGNVATHVSYDRFLDQALAQGRLIPLAYMKGFPGTSEEILLVYGQGKSAVRFLIERFGPQRLREFLKRLKRGEAFDQAMEAVYGFDTWGLDNLWRASLGAPPVTPPPKARLRPTPAPLPPIIPYGVTPTPGVYPTPLPKTPASAVTPTPRTPSPGCSPAQGGLESFFLALILGVVTLGASRSLGRR